MGQTQSSGLHIGRTDYQVGTCEPLNFDLDGLVVYEEYFCRRKIVFICGQTEKLVIKYRGKPEVSLYTHLQPKISVLSYCNQKLKQSSLPYIERNNVYYDWIYLESPTTVIGTIMKSEDSDSPDIANLYKREGNQFVQLRCYGDIIEKCTPEEEGKGVRAPVLVKPAKACFSLVQLCYEQLLRQTSPKRNIQTITRCAQLPGTLRTVHHLRLVKTRQ